MEHTLLHNCQSRALWVGPCPVPVQHSDPELSALRCQCHCRHHWALAQDPNSQHLGSTVWDASIVFAKYLEQVCPAAEASLLLNRGHLEPESCYFCHVMDLHYLIAR